MPGSLIDSPKSPEPCMPTPTNPNRTVSLGGTRPACSDVGARDAPTAAPLSSRNSRRDQVVFMVISPLSRVWIVSSTSTASAQNTGRGHGTEDRERDHRGGGRASGLV